jgi:hypothetical protein
MQAWFSRIHTLHFDIAGRWREFLGTLEFNQELISRTLEKGERIARNRPIRGARRLYRQADFIHWNPVSIVADWLTLLHRNLQLNTT